MDTIKPTNYYKKPSPEIKHLYYLLSKQYYSKADIFLKSIKNNLLAKNFVCSKNSYARHIFIEEPYWLAIVKWGKGAKTPIHGHPDLAFVYILNGVLKVRDYSHPPLKLSGVKQYKSGDYIYQKKGKAGCFDNGVHSVYAKSDGLSLHFYSDNPVKGVLFE